MHARTYEHAHAHVNAGTHTRTDLAPHKASVASSVMVKMRSDSECALENLRAEEHVGREGSAQLLVPDITISYV